MTDTTNTTETGPGAQGAWMKQLMTRLFPICRSLATPGNRETLEILSEFLPLDVVEVPTGTEIFGWTVPKEWRPRAAEITGPDGRQHARFADNNLHLVNGSEPVDMDIDLEDLLPHIHSLPDMPDLIPYVTSYYHPYWGFCMADAEKQALAPGRYHVRVDVEQVDGHLVYGEAVLPGNTNQEVLIDTYICHPSMANDNLSGAVVAAALYRALAALPSRHFTYRFIFVPETIGSICWLSNNEISVLPRIHAGLVFSCLGDDGAFSYKASRRGDTEIDRIAALELAGRGQVNTFNPDSGSDERQLCSPGFNLPVGMLSRTYPGEWPYYHTSGDTLDRVSAETLGESMAAALNILTALEANQTAYRRTEPRGEPMLSKHGLYHRRNERMNTPTDELRKARGSLMWLLSYADGDHDLLTIAEKCGAPIVQLRDHGEALVEAGLAERIARPLTG